MAFLVKPDTFPLTHSLLGPPNLNIMSNNTLRTGTRIYIKNVINEKAIIYDNKTGDCKLPSRVLSLAIG